jgi:hypothetical protein
MKIAKAATRADRRICRIKGMKSIGRLALSLLLRLSMGGVALGALSAVGRPRHHHQHRRRRDQLRHGALLFFDRNAGPAGTRAERGCKSIRANRLLRQGPEAEENHDQRDAESQPPIHAASCFRQA